MKHRMISKRLSMTHLRKAQTLIPIRKTHHWKPERVVIIEFPDMDSLNAWYNSPEYQPLIVLRKESTSDMDMLITLEGA